MSTRRWALAINVTLFAFLTFPPDASAQSWTEVVYDLPGGADGASILGDLVGFDGVLYGTTESGGNSNSGTVFSLTPPASPGGVPTETVLYSFIGGNDGSNPLASVVIGPGGILYGTTPSGGSSGYGTVFSLAPPSAPGGPWTETVIHAFKGSDGATPYGSVVIGYRASGQMVLYGTTIYGGSGSCLNGPNAGCGTVFSLTPPHSPGSPWTEAVLHNFAGGPSDGANAQSSLIIVADVLYGTTSAGGLSNDGTVFSLTPPHSPGGEWTAAVLHSFAGGGDGTFPLGKLTAGANGTLYGTTYEGGTWNSGTAFSLALSNGTWTETILHTFASGSDGALPCAGVAIGSGGVLYGTTAEGGSVGNDGTVFSLTPPASPGDSWTETVLHHFGPDSYGCFPEAGVVIDSRGVLYGATVYCGSYVVCLGGCGTVFSLTP